MHSTTNMASTQPQFNAQTDKLNRKRAGSKRAFYKGKTPKVSVKEELRRLVALEYPGADVPEVDQFKDDMVIFDGLVRYSTVDPEHVIGENITAKLREQRVSHIDLSHCKNNAFEFVKVVNKKICVPDGDEVFDARNLAGIYKHGAVYVRMMTDFSSNVEEVRYQNVLYTVEPINHMIIILLRNFPFLSLDRLFSERGQGS